MRQRHLAAVIDGCNAWPVLELAFLGVALLLTAAALAVFSLAPAASAQRAPAAAEARAGTLLDQMVPSIRKTADLVQEIAAASMEQSSGANQVNQAINQMSQITQQNASASEELAATAEEMSGQAEQLQQLMAFFQVDSQDIRPSAAPPKRLPAANKAVARGRPRAPRRPWSAPAAAPCGRRLPPPPASARQYPIDPLPR